MRLDFEVELADAPGQLSRVLEVVAAHGGNVLSVVHRHERAERGAVPVDISIEIPQPQSLRLLDALARSHRLLRVNREGGPARVALLLVGHVFQANLRDLLDAAFEHRAEATAVDARIAGRANPSAVLVSLTADDETALRKGVAALRKKAQQAKVSVLEQVPEDEIG